MIDALQLRLNVIRPALEHLSPVIPYSLTAENLLMGTCAQESKMGQWVVQLEDGPAKGIFQMEPATHDDIWINFLNYSRQKDIVDLLYEFQQTSDELVYNLRYAAMMCRIHYFRVPDRLPDDNPNDLGEYWKNYYNTLGGKGSIFEFIENYHKRVA